MKHLFCLVLAATFAVLAGNLAGSIAPDRKRPDEEDPPKDFTNSIGMKFVWIACLFLPGLITLFPLFFYPLLFFVFNSSEARIRKMVFLGDGRRLRILP
jgi:hypothetical protein